MNFKSPLFFKNKKNSLKICICFRIGYHVGQSSLVCHICGKQMRNKSSLNFHVKRHSEKRDFACPQCPQSFVYIKELERHMSSHIDSRKYVCTFEGCTKRFNDLYIFQLHKKRHLGLLERKYHCEYCEKRFTSKYALGRFNFEFIKRFIL